MQKHKKRILIVLDGVLNQYDGKYDDKYIPEIKGGAKEFMAELCKHATLYLFTSRNLLLTAKWLINNELDTFFEDITNIKLPSYLYIDDRAVCFDGNYDKTLKKIKSFQTYWDKTIS